MMNRPLLPVFAATLFTSAFLIFAIQPMASKMLLPLLGGSPSVWNTAMVFFQAMLLGGYAYAHVIAKYVPLKMQAGLHVALLCAFTFVLPLALPPVIAPPEESGQAMWQLGIMFSCIGGPFFVLAASAPLFQHWFASSGHADSENPYFLYAISNVGSMAALLGYPLLAEPLLTLHQQTQGWFYGYGVLIGLTAVCAWLVRKGVKPVVIHVGPALTGKTRLIWIGLSFIPSSLMLGVTTIITTDLASAPFLWIVPLAIYLATFIIAFSRKPVIGLDVSREAAAYLICLVAFMLMISSFVMLHLPMIAVHLVTFFFCALLCHAELAKARPSAAHLTEYFLLISAGGVLGGIFNALVAPVIFLTPMEYSITLAAVAFVMWGGSHVKSALNIPVIIVGIALCVGTYFIRDDLLQTMGAVVIFVFLLVMVQNRPAFAITALVALLLFHSTLWSTDKQLAALDRNYFGVIKVYEKNDMHFFYHGTTLHGAQSRLEKWKNVPTTYYSPGGPASDALGLLKGPTQKVAALGLGVGSVACHKASGRSYDFYEIDPDVVRIAENTDYFTYLKECGSPYKTILGDARLKIKDAPDHSFDMIFIDTFSSDNIPVHIMTKEAFETYLQKLTPDGIIAINISNRYLDLRAPLSAVAKELGLTLYYKAHQPEKIKGSVNDLYMSSIYAVMAKNPLSIAPLVEDHQWRAYETKGGERVWTDDYANILSALFLLR